MLFIAIFLFELIFLFFLSRALTQSLSRFLFRLTCNQTLTVQILSFLFLPGIIVHELSHLLIATILFVPVGEIEFLPKVTDKGVKLGSVAIGKTDPIRRALVGLAPIFIGLVILLGVGYHAQNSSMVQTIELQVVLLYIYILFVVGNTMFSSLKDLEGLLEVLLTAIFIAAVFYIFTIISGISLPSMQLPPQNIETVTSALAIVGAIAVIVDIFVLFLIRATSRLFKG